MKILMFFASSFHWEPWSRTLTGAEEEAAGGEASDAVIAFLHIESADAGNPSRAVTRGVKNIKWLAGKFKTREVVLHYFSHLSGDRSPPEAARELVAVMERRLAAAGYRVRSTPYGWVCRWGMEVVGESLGRVFVDTAAGSGDHAPAAAESGEGER